MNDDEVRRLERQWFRLSVCLDRLRRTSGDGIPGEDLGQMAAAINAVSWLADRARERFKAALDEQIDQIAASPVPR